MGARSHHHLQKHQNQSKLSLCLIQMRNQKHLNRWKSAWLNSWRSSLKTGTRKNDSLINLVIFGFKILKFGQHKIFLKMVQHSAACIVRSEKYNYYYETN